MDEAYELFWQFKYVEAEVAFQNLIDITDDIVSLRSIYQYLGLCQLFQGQSANAQASWLLSIDQDTSLDELFVFLRNIATEFGHKFNRSVDKLPKSITNIIFGRMFNKSLKNLITVNSC